MLFEHDSDICWALKKKKELSWEYEALYVHTMMISVQFLQRSGAALRRSLEWSFTYRIGSVPHFSAVKTVTQTVSEVNK